MLAIWNPKISSINGFWRGSNRKTSDCHSLEKLLSYEVVFPNRILFCGAEVNIA